MATNLPVNIDASNSDEGSPTRKTHQQHHDELHGYTNSHDGAPHPHPVYLRYSETTAALRPAAGTVGRLHRATDTGAISYDTGSAWTGLATAPAELTAPSAGVIPLVVKAASGQTANLLEARDSAGVLLARVASNGAFVAEAYATVGPGAAGAMGASGYALAVLARATNGQGLVVRGLASQTANLAEFQNSAGTVLASVSAAGVFTCVDGGNGTLVRALQFGATDSAGAGFRTVRVPN